MKTVLIYLMLGTFISPTVPCKKKFFITGKVTAAGSYCGGVAPSPDMLKQANATFPKKGYIIYFKKGTTNDPSKPIVDSVSTDAKGIYSIKLRPGNYVLLQKNQLDRSVFEAYKESTSSLQVNKEVMEKWWKKGLGTVTIKKSNIDNVNFHFQKRCFVPENMPFLRFTGPYPP